GGGRPADRHDDPIAGRKDRPMALVTNVIEGSAADRVLLLMHGYGADERDLGGLLPYLDPDGHFVTVLPRGPLAAPPGFAWFDIAAAEGDDAQRAFTEAVDLVDDLLHH